MWQSCIILTIFSDLCPCCHMRNSQRWVVQEVTCGHQWQLLFPGKKGYVIRISRDLSEDNTLQCNLFRQILTCLFEGNML